MKKTFALALALMLLLTAISALALSPQTPEVLKRAVAGQTFSATCRGYQSVGDNVSINILLYEQARYSQADIEAIDGTDYIDADIGAAMVYSVTPDGDGYILNDGEANADPVYLVPDGEGCFFAKDADGNFYMKEALELACPVADDAQYFTADDADTAHTAQELIDAIFDGYDEFESIEVTFNDDGEIAVLRCTPAT